MNRRGFLKTTGAGVVALTGAALAPAMVKAAQHRPTSELVAIMEHDPHRTMRGRDCADGPVERWIVHLGKDQQLGVYRCQSCKRAWTVHE